MKNFIKGSFVFINIALYITIIIMWIALPEQVTLNLSTTAFTICMTLILMYQEKERIQELVSSSFFENFMRNAFRAGLVLGLLGVVNYLGFKFPKQWDVTSDRANSLSHETELILKKLDKDIEFYVFANTEQRRRIIPLLELYQFMSPKVIVKAVDPETNPSLVREFGVKEVGEIGLKYGEKRVVVKSYDEISLSKAMLKVLREQQPKVLFTIGHGELDFRKGTPGSISKVYSYLRHSHYQVDQKSVLQIEDLNPYSAIFILGPTKTFLDDEVTELKSYVEKGGRLFLALDPNFDFKGKRKLENLLAGWGIELSNDVVMDMNSKVKGSKGLAPIISDFDKKHPLTRDFTGTLFFPVTSSVSANKNFRTGFKLTNLFYTSDMSWTKTNFDDVIKGDYKFSEGRKGPISLASSLVGQFTEGKESRVVAFGNSKFITDMYFGHGDNINFFLNLVSWLVDEDFIISSSRAAINKKPAFINPAQLNIIFFFSVIFIPLICGGIAFYLYRRRQNS